MKIQIAFVLSLMVLGLLGQDGKQLSAIDFGSCSNQDKDQSALYEVVEKHSDLFRG